MGTIFVPNPVTEEETGRKEGTLSCFLLSLYHPFQLSGHGSPLLRQVCLSREENDRINKSTLKCFCVCVCRGGGGEVLYMHTCVCHSMYVCINISKTICRNLFFPSMVWSWNRTQIVRLGSNHLCHPLGPICTAKEVRRQNLI